MVKIFKKNEASEFGFGTTTNSSGKRILNKDGSANILRLGEPRFNIINIYHSLITMRWWKFNLVVFLFYIATNTLFSLIYYFIAPNGIAGMIFTSEWEHFLEVFFFSAQSLTTVGYGRLNPIGTFTSSMAAIESMIGLLGFALATGLLYGRFSRPTAKLIYSDNILIAPYTHTTLSLNAPTALMFRIANARTNQLIEVEALLLFAYNEEVNGKIFRRFQRLKLEVEKINLLAMSWTVVHPINEESPLKELTAKDYETLDAEFMVNIKAIDDTYVQQVYSRTSYKWQELIRNAKFHSIISTADDGRTALDLRNISSYETV
ncbi:MAG: ion transporter [Bacteroidetes bacterium]|nr:ion transporter [Bacteroidota bacterium]